MAKQDKFNKPFLPGQAGADKQERETKKMKVQAKKARKMGLTWVPMTLEAQARQEIDDTDKKFQEEYTNHFSHFSHRESQISFDRFRDLVDGFVSVRQPEERTFDDLAEEFEDLMANHDRLMSHFKGV